MAISAEQDLIARAKAGDRVAYERLLEPAVRSAARLAFAMLQDRSEAEDAFQESAIRAWRRLRNLRDGDGPDPAQTQFLDANNGFGLKIVSAPCAGCGSIVNGVPAELIYQIQKTTDGGHSWTLVTAMVQGP